MATADGQKTGGRTLGTPNRRKASTPAGKGAEGVSFPIAGARARGLPPYRLERIDRLVPYERNARTHSPAQVDMLAKMITEYGWTNPVLVDAKRGIIAGHGRVMAARQLGMDSVPVIELAHLTSAQRRAYVLADNKSAEAAGWDEDLLRLELGDLQGFDMALTGFAAPELAALFEDAPAFDPPEAFASYDEAIKTDHVCPSCGYQFSGGTMVAPKE